MGPWMRLENLDDIQKHSAEVDWLIGGLLQTQGLTILYGPAGVGKTFLSLSIALSLAAYEKTPQGKLQSWSGSFDLRPLRKAHVVYWIGEGGVSIRARIKSWLKTPGAKKNAPFKLLDQISTANTLMNKAKTGVFFQNLWEAIEARNTEADGRAPLPAGDQREGSKEPVLLVIDTLSATHPAFDENDARSAGVIMQNCRLLIDSFKATHPLSILIIHHSTKRGGMRGHSRLIGDPDTVLSVSKIGRAAERALVLRTEKQRAAEAKGNLFLSYDAVTMQFQRRGTVSNPDKPKRGPKPDAKLRILQTIAHELRHEDFTNEDLRRKLGEDVALVTVAKLTKTLFDKKLLDRKKTNSGLPGNAPNAYTVVDDDFLGRAHTELGLETAPPASGRPKPSRPTNGAPPEPVEPRNKRADAAEIAESPKSPMRKTRAKKTTAASDTPDTAQSQ